MEPQVTIHQNNHTDTCTTTHTHFSRLVLTKALSSISPGQDNSPTFGLLFLITKQENHFSIRLVFIVVLVADKHDFDYVDMETDS